MRHRYALLLLLLLAIPSWCFAQTDEPVFSRDEAVTATESSSRTASPSHLATAYWSVTATMDVRAAAAGTHVQMLLPLSDDRQSVLARRTTAEGVAYREEADGLNLWGHWRVTSTEDDTREIAYEYVVQITDTAMMPPDVPFPPVKIAARYRPYLQASPLIQSDDARVRELGRQVVHGIRKGRDAVTVLYKQVADFAITESGPEQNDALTVIKAARGSRAGKTRALVALLRAVGIPARVVGGIRLGDTAQKRTTITWVEALVGETWVPMDPASGYFAWLPNTYLALYRNDLPLLMHTRAVEVEYTFAIRQLTRGAAIAIAQPERSKEGQQLRSRQREQEHTHTIANYVDRPQASIVLLNDGAIPPEVAEQILAESQQNRVNIALLSIETEPGAFREQYLQALVSTNINLLREAHVLLLRTTDAAALHALLKQGELGVRLPELRIVVTSDMPTRITTMFASILLRVLAPVEVIVVDRSIDVLHIWHITRTHLQSQRTLAESARQQAGDTILVNGETVAKFHWWRRWVIDLWTTAVRAQVPLPALNLLLTLPLIAFFLVIIRNVIGLETFGTFSPMLLSLAFLTTGLGWGLVVFAFIVGLGTALRMSLQRLRLHLVARVAILIAVVAMSMVGMTVLGAMLGVGALLHASIFPMVIMANVIENFTNTQLERGTKEAVRLTVSTLLVATCSYIGIENTGLKSLVLTFPELLLGVIAIELMLGRWRGLRLSEYLRFRKLLEEPDLVEAGKTREVSAK